MVPSKVLEVATDLSYADFFQAATEALQQNDYLQTLAQATTGDDVSDAVATEPFPEHHGEEWTDEQDSEIVDLYVSSRIPLSEVAEYVGRTERAVRMRLEFLGYTAS